VVVVGAGGAAVSALVALREVGARVTLAARDATKARAIAAKHGCDSCAVKDLPALAFDVLVNCTPAGSLAVPNVMPIPAEALRRGLTVLDAVYRPRETPLLREAARRGCHVLGGSEWFVRQALAQFRLFTGRDADETLMRAELERALAAESAS